MPASVMALALLALIGNLSMALAADRIPGRSSKTPAPADVFTNQHPPRIQIEIPEEGIKRLREAPRGTEVGGEFERTSVKAIVREGGKTYTDVAVHLKGGAGSFRGIDDRPSLTLNFDKHVKGQTFRGIERISLNSSIQDPTWLNEILARERFAAAGIPVPRAAHATVQLNGRDLGVYVLVEAFNKQFLAAHFASPEGNLYDGGLRREITDPLEKNSGPKPDDHADLKKLAQAAMESDRAQRLERLASVLDLDRFITYLALDVMMCNWDGYALNLNNYRIYHDPTTDKLVFMPHGLDQMFGGGQLRMGADMPIFPRTIGMVARSILATQEGRRRYRERVSDLSQRVYDVPAMTNRAWELAARIRPILEEKGPGAVRKHEEDVAELCERIAERAESIRDQLATHAQALKFDSAGVARFSEWKNRSDYGKAGFKEITEDGKRILHIKAQGSCVGVWLAPVSLEPGLYRFEGRVKCRAVKPDPGDRRAGAGLRVSGHRATQHLTGDADWTEFSFEFDPQVARPSFGFGMGVQDDIEDLELLCELRAASGEAWFDLDSLRLVKQ